MNLVEKDCWPKSTTSQLIINGFMLNLFLIFFSSTKERELQRLLQEKDSEIREMKRELKAKDRKLADKDGVSLALISFSFIFLSFSSPSQLRRDNYSDNFKKGSRNIGPRKRLWSTRLTN